MVSALWKLAGAEQMNRKIQKRRRQASCRLPRTPECEGWQGWNRQFHRTVSPELASPHVAPAESNSRRQPTRRDVLHPAASARGFFVLVRPTSHRVDANL